MSHRDNDCVRKSTLSGLHSYAAGDPVPIPSWVYYTTVALTSLALLSWWRHRRYVKAGAAGGDQ
ncbi:MAG: hypothetical protein KDC54_06410 [Lewinella sp.]|nr:hypothetical protein [Lewinella sp.]